MLSDRHGGNLRKLSLLAGIPPEEILDFSANINPLGPPEWLRAAVSRSVEYSVHYPDPESTSLISAAAARYGISCDEIVAGNGSTELLYIVPRACRAKRAVIPVPSYADYGRSCALAGIPAVKIFLPEERWFRPDTESLDAALEENDLVFIGQPNNPTGISWNADSIRELALRNPSVTFVADEAFADFAEDMDRLTAGRPANLIVLLSLTKFFAVPGLRLGLAAADPVLAGRIRGLMPPWSVNSVAQAVGEKALLDRDYAARTRSFMKSAREKLHSDLESIGRITVYPGEANFLLVRIDSGPEAPVMAGKLLKKGIAVRVCDNFEGLDGRFFRVAVRTESENARLCDELSGLLTGGKMYRARKKPAVMFQGTGSNAGKSILAAAFCRILLQDGCRVAPFKAQNMSLNSFVTRDGGEMGRAQVVQAQACRLDPDVRMNPVLLKPNSDTGAQVIVLGKPVGNMDVARYIEYKPRAFREAKNAFEDLSREYDALVLEGAGSPAEVNLKHHDIVNMSMARHAGAPVLLVGDIDRGGVFASFVGTMEVLAEWERALVAGFIINRFRGDKSLLQCAIDYTAGHTGKPTFGVVPFIPELGIPEEDSVSFKSGLEGGDRNGDREVEIALIDLPHISNFTDFDSLRMEPDVFLRVVRSAEALGAPGAVIIPGSKNVIGDLEYLNKSGLARKIAELSSTGTEVVGICGGYQLLGGEIADPLGIESAGKTVPALGLLPVRTVLAREKILQAVSGIHAESGCAVRGYEIHHGQTNGEGLKPAVVLEDGKVIGARSEDGLLWGSYLHGIFDADRFRRWFIDRLRVRKGIPPAGGILREYDLEPALDRLASLVRESVDVKAIYRLMGLA